MRRLGSTVARLHKMRRASLAAMAKIDSLAGAGSGCLATMTGFGTNPGALVAKTYLPQTLAKDAPLVVVLHGCTQNASVYDRGSGWSELADRHGFAVLFPEQTRTNNHNLCFNWYQSGDRRRGQGEPASIAQMIRHMIASHDLDPARVFITGLSAGGAMTSVMLATHPELFAGGAIIAGLPFGVAEGVPQALERMRGSGMPTRRALASKIVNASDHPGPWPTLSVWHGTADSLVVPVNADVIVDQWRDRIGLDGEGEVDRVDGHQRTMWRDGDRTMIERIDVQGMGHGTPLSTQGKASCGTVGPHMLEAGICSTSRIAASWGLTGKVAKPAPARAEPMRPTVAVPVKVTVAAKPRPRHAPAQPRAKGVGAVIEDALRAAGLMR